MDLKRFIHFPIFKYINIKKYILLIILIGTINNSLAYNLFD